LKILKYILYLAGFCFFTWFLASCANPVSPTGGPTDTKPPILLKADPPQASLNFTDEKIELVFDEFVTLNKINEQMMISPPMEVSPEFKIKGKSVIIELKSALKDSTTYNIFVGDAIVDITEANPIKNFRYVFSTGNVLDSLSLKGEVLNAFDLKPVENINILLYLDNNDTIPTDSLPYFVKPYYLSRTDKEGKYEFHNLLDKPYKIFALEDVNNNLIFDQVTERIAFIDSLVKPYFIYIPIVDTTMADSLALHDSVSSIDLMDEKIKIIHKPEIVTIDSAFFEIPDYEFMPDSLLFDSGEDIYGEPSPLTMHLFTENDSVQRFLKATMENEHKLVFIYRQPTINHQIAAMNLLKDTTWYMEEVNHAKDTVTYWITTLLQDSITFKIADDTLVLDTVDVALVKKSRNKREEKKADEKPAQISFTFSKNAPTLDLPYRVRFNFPILEYSLEGSMLIEGEDTLSPLFQFDDSIRLSGLFNHKWKEETNYTLLIPDSSFTNILHQSHDTVQKQFRTKALADWGNLYINLSVQDTGKNYIVQLLMKDKIHTEIQVQNDQRLSFEYLDPGDYTLKVIYDNNSNGKWDTGDYIYKIQPEKVGYFTKTITVRANWDIEEEWEL
jgi:hypothetical protein